MTNVKSVRRFVDVDTVKEVLEQYLPPRLADEAVQELEFFATASTVVASDREANEWIDGLTAELTVKKEREERIQRLLLDRPRDPDRDLFEAYFGFEYIPIGASVTGNGEYQDMERFDGEVFTVIDTIITGELDAMVFLDGESGSFKMDGFSLADNNQLVGRC